MLWVKACHIIALVAWFSGLFYLPRLFIYHTKWHDPAIHERFKIMERKLYYMITTPAGILALCFGVWVLSYDFAGYMHQPWMHMKLTFVFFLVLYHAYLGKTVRAFQRDHNPHKLGFYHMLHAVPSVLLIIIVILAVVKPAGMLH